MRGVVAASGSAGTQDKQYVLINLLKAVAAQLIVLHHLAFYGPMADHARVLAPALFDWLADDARIAVQVFLVIGGFLAAKSLAPDGFARPSNPLAIIWRRYIKLAPPFVIATLLAVCSSSIASMLMTHNSISGAPSLSQLAAHVLLLHSVLGYESLSAGAWYVAIDFQLYVSATFLLWLCSRLCRSIYQPRLIFVTVMMAILSSLVYFNRHPDWDVWAPYFFGSYGLGMLAWLIGAPGQKLRTVLLLFLMIVVLTVAALVLDYRSRIAVAFIVSFLLMLLGRLSVQSNAAWTAVNWLGKNSYSIFLVHFSVCLVTNAAFTKFFPETTEWQATGTVAAWFMSIVGGGMFYLWVEMPLARKAKLENKAQPIGKFRHLNAKSRDAT